MSRPAEQNLEVGPRKRLGKVVPRPRAQRLDAGIDARVPGDHDDDRVRVRVETRTQQPHARDLWHAEVEQHDVEPIPLEGFARLVPAAAHAHLVAFVLQYAGAALAQRTFVVDDQHADAGLELGSHQLCDAGDMAGGSGTARSAQRAIVVQR